MAKLALMALSLTLGILFIFVGTIKLTPAIHPELHKEMKIQFKEHRKVFPFYTLLGWRPKNSEYRKAVGTIELVCGLVLAFVPGRLKTVSNLVLIMLMVGAIYSHWALHHEGTKMTGALVFLLLLVCRMVIHLQSVAESGNVKAD